jgi:putative spermidine/putrescine transport system permease protein
LVPQEHPTQLAARRREAPAAGRREAPAAGRREAIAAISLLGPASLLMVLVLVVPLGVMLRDSLNRFDPAEMMLAAVTPENYIRFFADPFYRGVLYTTIRVSVIVTLACLACGMPMAWRLARATSRWKPALVVLTVLPLFIGSTTRTAGWMILFTRGGMLDILSQRLFGAGPINLMYSEPAVVLGIIAINLPFTILTLQSVFEGIDPRLEEAAASMGAAPSRAFWRIVFPLALPGVSIAGVLCFILCMNAFATPVLLGGPRFQMMAPLLYWAFSGDNNWPFAAALAFILMATTLGLTGLANVMIPRRYRRG